MAVTFQITDGTTTVDFTSTTGFQAQEDYLPTFAIPTGDGTIPGYITESIPVLIHITSGNNFASTMQDFHALQVGAAQFHADITYETPVWFHRKMDDETGATRALVRSMHFTPDDQFGGHIDTVPILTTGRTGTLTIEHHPYCERTSAVSASSGSNLSVLGGGSGFNYTDVVGDVPARLYYCRLYGGSVGITFEKAWIGFRSDAKVASGDASQFVSLWEVENGANLNNASATTDATASPGGGGDTKIAVTPGASWAQNFTIDVDTVDAGNPGAFDGAFLVLMRAKVDAGTTQVKLKHYLVEADGPSKFNQVVDVSATSWTIYNIGVVTFPTRNRRAFPIALKDATHDRAETLGLWSRDKPGDASTTMDVDCFVLIPCDELFIYVHNTAVDSVSESWIGVAPDEESAAYTLGTTGDDYWYESSPSQIIGAGLPVGDGRMFICVANASDAAPAYDDDIDVDLTWYPRWISYRGAE